MYFRSKRFCTPTTGESHGLPNAATPTDARVEDGERRRRRRVGVVDEHLALRLNVGHQQRARRRATSPPPATAAREFREWSLPRELDAGRSRSRESENANTRTTPVSVTGPTSVSSSSSDAVAPRAAGVSIVRAAVAVRNLERNQLVAHFGVEQRDVVLHSAERRSPSRRSRTSSRTAA